MDDDFDLIGAALTESGIDLDEESFVSFHVNEKYSLLVLDS